MHYRTLVINLFSTMSGEEERSTGGGGGGEKGGGGRGKSPIGSPPTAAAPHTPESETTGGPRYNAAETIQSSARAIARLARLHRREYGMGRAHHFALYAMNLGLFAMLESDTFDVLDNDFLTLSSAFSVVASRSPLGRNLFHIFRQSVRAKRQGSRVRAASTVPDDLKELFDEEVSTRTKWDEYAEGLEKLDEDERYRGGFGLITARDLGGDQDADHAGDGGGAQRDERRTMSKQKNTREFHDLSLFDMLDRYESLSLGKDELLHERSRSA